MAQAAPRRLSELVIRDGGRALVFYASPEVLDAEASSAVFPLAFYDAAKSGECERRPGLDRGVGVTFSSRGAYEAQFSKER